MFGPLLTLLILVTISRGDNDTSVLINDAPNFRSDYIFDSVANGYLKYQEIPANFKEARLRCHLEGAILASPLNYRLEMALRQLMDQKNPFQAILTGIHATFSRGDFFSVEGVHLPLIVRSWAESEPNNLLNKESCMKLTGETEMSDVNCEDPLPYVCYKQAGNYKQNECGTVDDEYKLDSRTGSCYKFHRLPRTWSRAYMTCTAEGGHLAIINSKTEAYVIKELFAKNPSGVIQGKGWKDVAYVGFHDWGEHGEFLTIEGQTLKQAGYNAWSPGEPNNSTTGEFCGAVYRTALYNDLWCEKLYAFICEKDPKKEEEELKFSKNVGNYK